MKSCLLPFSVGFGLLLLIGHAGHAQNKLVVDSLLKRLAVTETTGHITVLNELAGEYAPFDSAKAMAYATQALSLSQAGHHTSIQVESLNQVAEINRLYNRKKEAKEQFELARKLAEATHNNSGLAKALLGLGNLQQDNKKALLLFQAALPKADTKTYAKILRAMGSVEIQLGNYAEALTYLEQAFSLAQSLGDVVVQARAQEGLGLLYSDLGQNKEALAHDIRSLRLSESLHDSARVAASLNDVAYDYLQLDSLSLALHYGNRSLALTETIHNKPNQQATLSTLAEIYLAIKDYPRAEKALNRMFDKSFHDKDYHHQSVALRDLAILYLATGRNLPSLNNARESARIGKTIGNRLDVREAVKIQALAAAALGLYPEAYQAQRVYLETGDSLKVEETNKMLAFRVGKEALNREKEKTKYQKQINDQQERQRDLLMIGLGIVILFSIFQVRAYLRQRKANAQLANQKAEIETSNEELATSLNALGEAKSTIEVLREVERNRSQTLFETVVNKLPQVLMIYDAEKKIRFANSSALELFGIPFEQMYGKYYYEVFIPQRVALWEPHFLNAYATKLPQTFELIDEREELHQIQFVDFIPILTPTGEIDQILGLATDVTDQKLFEAKITKSLHEKEILLAEIHHRVKNNLSMISSMMQLQADKSNDARLNLILTESTNRIYAMSLIHEKLYQSDMLSRIDLSEYVRDLVATIQHAIKQENQQIEVNYLIQDVFLDIVAAVPLCLILNELITNAYKHAFKGRTTGVITIEISPEGEQTKLVVSDNGVGLPFDFDPKQKSSLGWTLVDVLTRQLKGKLTVIKDVQTSFIITFNPEQSRVIPANVA